MTTEYEIEHNITDMGEPPHRSLINAFRAFFFNHEQPTRDDMLTMEEALGMTPDDLLGVKSSGNPAMKAFREMEEQASTEDTEACVICQDRLCELGTPHPESRGDDEEERRKIKTSPCGHKFHFTCLKIWLEKVNSCPFCRYAYKSDSEHADAERQANLEELHDSMFS